MTWNEVGWWWPALASAAALSVVAPWATASVPRARQLRPATCRLAPPRVVVRSR